MVTELDLDADPTFEPGDHPDEVTEEEAKAGHEVYLKVDDLDDESNGFDE